MNQIDERDIMFSRMNYKKGSEQYKDYYKRNPNKERIDDFLRSLPGLGSKDSGAYDEFGSRLVDSNFKLISDFNSFAEGGKVKDKVKVDKKEITSQIKKLANYFGAVKFGITTVSNEFVYSNRGRKAENYGEIVDLNHNNIIIIGVEMDNSLVNRAPNVEQTIEVSQCYLKALVISMQIAYFIRNLGYNARAHVDGNYLVYLPLAAKKAGIGEIGLNNMIVTKKYGSRIRLAGISTNLPLLKDKEVNFGLGNLCKICKVCKENCIGKAIDEDYFKEEDCFEIWQKIGTDCGICINSCPLSQPLNSDIKLEIINNNMITEELANDIMDFHNKNYIKRNYLSKKHKLLD